MARSNAQGWKASVRGPAQAAPEDGLTVTEEQPSLKPRRRPPAASTRKIARGERGPFDLGFTIVVSLFLWGVIILVLKALLF